MNPPAFQAQRPNLVVVICDDLAWGDLSCHGNPWVETPRLDALAGESARLTRCCSGPLCTPARASLLTGRYPYRTRAIDTYMGRSMLDPTEVTLAEVLRGAGYATGLFGKWHLGDNYPMRPLDKGFEECVMHLGGGLRQPANHGRDSYMDPELMAQGRLQPFQGFCTDIFTDLAIDFLRRHRSGPFFTYLAYNAPHSPFDDIPAALPDLYAKHRERVGHEEWAAVYAMVENIDTNVGRLLAELKALKIEEDTLVLFTSDHGPCPSAGMGERKRFNAGLRGVKGELYEGGVRVPSFWRWPRGGIRPGPCDRIANPIDVLPTFLEAADVRLPADWTIDGVSLLPLLQGAVPTGDWPDRKIFMQWHRGDVPRRFSNYAVWTQRYKLVNGSELYNLDQDPSETENIAASHLDTMGRLREAYEAWFDDVSATRPSNYDPPAIVIDFDHELPSVLTRQDWRGHGNDGWEDDIAAHWVLAASGQQVDITLHFSQTGGRGEAFLCLNDRAFSSPVLPSPRHARFQGIRLPKGRFHLEAWACSASAQAPAAPLRVVITPATL